MRNLIVVAEKEELSLIDKLNESTKRKLEGLPVLITGVGALNVINALKDIPKDVHIINIGYAGSKNLTIDRFYEVNSVSLNHSNVSYHERTYKLDWVGEGDYNVCNCYSGSDFVLQSDINGCLFDMELAYICALGFTSVSSLKYVSDNLDLQEYRSKLN